MATPRAFMCPRFVNRVVRFYSTNPRASIKSLIATSPPAEGVDVHVTGWVRVTRKLKERTFVNINDGSCTQSLQVIFNREEIPEDLTFGSAVCIQGRLVASPAKGQSVELIPEKVEVVGKCDDECPIAQKHQYSPDYLRHHLHLRSRTDGFGALLRVRNAATMAFHHYFQDRGYLHVNTPVISSIDCEGAGQLFQVEPLDRSVTETVHQNHQRDSQEDSGGPGHGNSSDGDHQQPAKGTQHFFNVPAYLTVSGQLHLETMASSHSKVYTLGPAFRAEGSRHANRHLSEFYMLEAEIAFIDDLQDLLEIMEDCFKSVTTRLLDTCDNVEYFFRNSDHRHKLQKMLDTPFHRLTYKDAIGVLEKSEETFQLKPEFGSSLKREHEKYLVKFCGNMPVFVTDFPEKIAPFYTKANCEDAQTVSSVDLLVPGSGELFGGSMREESLQKLQQKLKDLSSIDQYNWYLDLRRFGSVPHGGFGMGFDRYLQCVLGIANIKDTIPFPRSPLWCQL